MAGPLSPTRILVVEDEADIAQLIKHTLERSGGAIVDVVGNGALPRFEMKAARFVLEG